MEPTNILQQIVLGEVAGKNAAIHAYDSVTWKIRTGFLTLLFAGWGLLLKSLAEHESIAGQGVTRLVVGMVFVSVGLTLGGWFIDRNYLRHKFRVILALDQLMDAIGASAGDYKTIPTHLLKVAGHDADRPFLCGGYREAVRTGQYVFFAPLLTLVVASAFLLKG